MAIYHQPTGDRESRELIRTYRPPNSDTTVWLLDMVTNQIVRMLHWGSEIYLPVYDGMHLGIGVHNGGRKWMAYPAYVENLNLWQDGQSLPEQCDTDHMWELQPGMSMVMDKLMNPSHDPERQVGRPFIVTSVGKGRTIGEATSGTDVYHGLIRLFEREGNWQSNLQSYRPVYRGDAIEKGVDLSEAGIETRGLNSGKAGIGLGDEVHQAHSDTGLTYQREAKPVISLRVEYRADLQPMLDQAWANFNWNWIEPLPFGENWWNQPWSWRPQPTAPQVPVTKPKPDIRYK